MTFLAILRDVSERKQVEAAKEAAVTAERNRLARDLHDTVTQTLFSASQIAGVLPRLWERQPDEGRRRTVQLHELTASALAEMRTLLLELRPQIVPELGLGDLLRQLVSAASNQSGLVINLAVEGERPVPPDVQVALYRIVQEALNNVGKHAQATEANVEVQAGSQGVTVRVQDNGRGFDPQAVPPSHLGLGIMRERAEAIGAKLTIASQAGHGAQVTVRWPA
jgi:signal transduction histidine kinase